jgi:hypothetical protein
MIYSFKCCTSVYIFECHQIFVQMPIRGWGVYYYDVITYLLHHGTKVQSLKTSNHVEFIEYELAEECIDLKFETNSI